MKSIRISAWSLRSLFASLFVPPWLLLLKDTNKYVSTAGFEWNGYKFEWHLYNCKCPVRILDSPFTGCEPSHSLSWIHSLRKWVREMERGGRISPWSHISTPVSTRAQRQGSGLCFLFWHAPEPTWRLCCSKGRSPSSLKQAQTQNPL